MVSFLLKTGIWSNDYVLLITSAVLYALALINPFFCAEGVFLVWLPLVCYFDSDNNKDVLSYGGLVWGAVFYGITYWDLGLILVYKSNCGIVISLLLSLFLLVYCICGTYLWFLCIRWVLRFFDSRLIRMLSVVFFSLVYLIWVDCGHFFIFGRFVGCHLQNLLLPLMIRPWLLFLRYHNPYYAVTLLLLLSICMRFIMQKSYNYFLYMVLCLFPFFASWFIHNPAPYPYFLPSVGALMPPRTNQPGLWARAHYYATSLAYLYDKHPEWKLILMPESALAYPLNCYPACIDLLFCLGTIADDVFLLCGSQELQGDILYNCAYLLNRCRIIQRYHKQKPFFFIEALAGPWTLCKNARKIFLGNNREFAFGTLPSLLRLPLGDWRCMLCSEFFVESHGKKNTAPFIVLANDSWFEHAYIPYLMYLYVHYYAVVNQQPILYCSWNFACYVNQYGTHYDIEQYENKK